MNSLYFTIGLPRSGKSTWARAWLQGTADIANNRFTRDFPTPLELSRIDSVKRIIVTPDAFRLALGHRYNWYAEPVVFAHVQIAIRALVQDYDVLVDDTHTSIESITRILEVDPNANYVFVDTPLDVCIERAIATNQGDLVGVMARMQNNINRLEAAGGFRNNFTVLRDEVKNHSSRKIIV